MMPLSQLPRRASMLRAAPGVVSRAIDTRDAAVRQRACAVQLAHSPRLLDTAVLQRHRRRNACSSHAEVLLPSPRYEGMKKAWAFAKVARRRQARSHSVPSPEPSQQRHMPAGVVKTRMMLARRPSQASRTQDEVRGTPDDHREGGWCTRALYWDWATRGLITLGGFVFLGACRRHGRCSGRPAHGARSPNSQYETRLCGCERLSTDTDAQGSEEGSIHYGGCSGRCLVQAAGCLPVVATPCRSCDGLWRQQCRSGGTAALSVPAARSAWHVT